MRERYGETKFGQSLLLARRLVEAGVSLVTVNWDDETRNDKVSPFWDTHNHNFAALKNRLAPRFDQSFSALLEDLDQRGLLETTLVVVTGEFGRTPKIGQVMQNGMTEKTGRDHWPHAFTVLLAGGGVRGGQVYGATNKNGALRARPARLAGRPFGHDPRSPGDRRQPALPRRISADVAAIEHRSGHQRPGLTSGGRITCKRREAASGNLSPWCAAANPGSGRTLSSANIEPAAANYHPDE